jgi:hypothetical protein
MIVETIVASRRCVVLLLMRRDDDDDERKKGMIEKQGFGLKCLRDKIRASKDPCRARSRQ